MLDIVNDILELSRIENNDTTLKTELTSIEEVMNDTAKIIDGLVYKKNLTFDVNYCASNELVYCDKVKLKQIMINILGNAVKFTEEGNILLEITNKIPVNDLIQYEFKISDTGIGMSKEFIGKMFNAFEREYTSTISGQQGTGLGLTITKNLVELMDGEIEVKSKLGKGSTFKIKIPFKRAKTIENFQEETITPKELVGLRVLIVEDNLFNREITKEILSDYNFEIEEAEDGSQALNLLKERQANYYDFILMDIQMPNMNGYEATKAIRDLEDKNKANIPIIALTADAFEEDKKKALQSGMNAHIGKPAEANQIIDTINEIMQI